MSKTGRRGFMSGLVALGAAGQFDATSQNEQPQQNRNGGVQYVDPADGYQALLEALETIGTAPGTVIIGPGSIDNIDGNVTIPANTWLRGQGMYSTSLSFSAEADLDLAGMVRVEDENVVISDLELDGNRQQLANTGQEYGFYTSGARHVAVERVYAHDFPGYGFDPHADGSRPSRQVSITNCVAERNGLDGFTFAAVEDGVLSNNTAVENDRHGFNATDEEGVSITMTNNVSRSNGSAGVVVQNQADNITITGNLFAENDADGVRIGNGDDTSRYVTVSSNIIRANGSYGLNLRASESVTISNNQFTKNNRQKRSSAEIATTATGPWAQDILITGNQLQARADTKHGIDERDGNGPCLIATNMIRGAGSSSLRTSHAETMTNANLQI